MHDYSADIYHFYIDRKGYDSGYGMLDTRYRISPKKIYLSYSSYPASINKIEIYFKNIIWGCLGFKNRKAVYEEHLLRQ